MRRSTITIDVNYCQVGLGENIGEIGVTSTEKDKLKAAAIPTSSDLDQFMVAFFFV